MRPAAASALWLPLAGLLVFGVCFSARVCLAGAYLGIATHKKCLQQAQSVVHLHCEHHTQLLQDF